METKTFYRVANTQTQQGLWYDFNGNFTGLIHTKYNFCTNNQLPMPFDENIVGWLSATDNLNDLYHWFTEEDITNLYPFGYRILEYEADDYKFYNNHWIIKQETSKIKSVFHDMEALRKNTIAYKLGWK